jgi:hypothetical protein
MLFEARPIGIERRSGLRVNIRSAGEILPFKAVRVTVTIDCQHLKGSLESENLEQNRTKCARGVVRIMKDSFGGSWKTSEQAMKAAATRSSSSMMAASFMICTDKERYYTP